VYRLSLKHRPNTWEITMRHLELCQVAVCTARLGGKEEQSRFVRVKK
jgi:hypothetical protein